MSAARHWAVWHEKLMTSQTHHNTGKGSYRWRLTTNDQFELFIDRKIIRTRYTAFQNMTVHLHTDHNRYRVLPRHKSGSCYPTHHFLQTWLLSITIYFHRWATHWLSNTLTPKICFQIGFLQKTNFICFLGKESANCLKWIERQCFKGNVFVFF